MAKSIYYMTAVLFLLFSTSAFAQISVQRSTIGTAGSNVVQQQNLTASWTVGESITGTSVHGTIIVTSGFQQGHEENSVAIKSPNKNINIKVFPNPTYGEIQVQLQDISTKDILVEIFNNRGQKIHVNNTNIATDQLSFNISKLPDGIYFLLIMNSEKDLIGNVKIIKAD